MSSELIHVPFDDSEILCVRDDNGGEYVVLRPLCERLGLDPRAQQRRLQRAAWAKGAAIMAAPSAGGAQETFLLPRRRLAMWLATLPAARAKAEVRPYLEALQDKAADVLDQFFAGKAPKDPVLAAINEIGARLAKLEAAAQVKPSKPVETLPPAAVPAPAKTDRMRVREVVDTYVRTTKIGHSDAWRLLYSELRLRVGFDALTRATKRRVSALQVVEDAGHMRALLGLAQEMLTEDRRAREDQAVREALQALLKMTA